MLTWWFCSRPQGGVCRSPTRGAVLRPNWCVEQVLVASPRAAPGANAGRPSTFHAASRPLRQPPRSRSDLPAGDRAGRRAPLTVVRLRRGDLRSPRSDSKTWCIQERVYLHLGEATQWARAWSLTVYGEFKGRVWLETRPHMGRRREISWKVDYEIYVVFLSSRIEMHLLIFNGYLNIHFSLYFKMPETSS